MKKSLIMIGISGLLLQLSAKEYLENAPTRAQMLLEAKQLLQREEMLKIKKSAWRKRQIVLLDDFNKIYEMDEQFGTKNLYGKKRLEKRQRDFYMSLQEQNDELEKNQLTLKRKLAKVRKQFSNLYAAPLTIAEIKGGSSPKIADKRNKIRLLKEYLNSKKSWKTCLQKNKSFDSKRVDIENRADFSSKRYEQSSAKLDKEIEKNYKQLDKYKQMSQNALQEYSKKYGYKIKNEKLAKRILSNIKN